MTALPVKCTTVTIPFAPTGIDLAGSYDIKNFDGKACLITKRYKFVFVSFATRALYLEPVSDLTTEEFILFFPRGGCPPIFIRTTEGAL